MRVGPPPWLFFGFLPFQKNEVHLLVFIRLRNIPVEALFQRIPDGLPE